MTNKGAYTSIMPAALRDLSKFMEEGPLCVCGNIRKAVRAVTQLFDDTLRSLDLKATQMSLLGHCGKLGAATISQLAEALVMDRTTLTRNLRPLEKRGLLQIRLGKDRREREVTLTKKGVELLAQAYPLWKKAQTQVAKGLGPERIGRLLSDLSSVVEIAQSR